MRPIARLGGNAGALEEAPRVRELARARIRCVWTPLGSASREYTRVSRVQERNMGGAADRMRVGNAGRRTGGAYGGDQELSDRTCTRAA